MENTEGGYKLACEFTFCIHCEFAVLRCSTLENFSSLTVICFGLALFIIMRQNSVKLKKPVVAEWFDLPLQERAVDSHTSSDWVFPNSCPKFHLKFITSFDTRMNKQFNGVWSSQCELVQVFTFWGKACARQWVQLTSRHGGGLRGCLLLPPSAPHERWRRARLLKHMSMLIWCKGSWLFHTVHYDGIIGRGSRDELINYYTGCPSNRR